MVKISNHNLTSISNKYYPSNINRNRILFRNIVISYTIKHPYHLKFKSLIDVTFELFTFDFE